MAVFHHSRNVLRLGIQFVSFKRELFYYKLDGFFENRSTFGRSSFLVINMYILRIIVLIVLQKFKIKCHIRYSVFI